MLMTFPSILCVVLFSHSAKWLDEELRCFGLLPKVESTIEVGLLPDDLPDPARWTAETLLEKEVYEWTWDIPRVHIVSLGAATTSPAEAKEVPLSESLWDGATWYVASPAMQSYSIDRAPKLGVMTDCMGLFNYLNWPVIGAPEGLPAAFAKSKVLRREETDADVRVRISRNREDSVQMEFVIEKASGRLREMIFDSLGPPSNRETGLPMSTIRFVVLEWTTIDGHAIPCRAFREARIYKHDLAGATPEHPFIQRTGYVRRAIKSLGATELGASEFEPPPFAVGDVVSDKSLRVAYKIGSTQFMLDGQVFELPTPINDRVRADDIADMMKGARLIGAAKGQ